MEQQNIVTGNSSQPPIKINFDDFNIGEDSFKPVTKGLGFHQDQKRQPSFKVAPKEIQTFSNSTTVGLKMPNHPLLNEISKTNKGAAGKVAPTGLEAFYSTSVPASDVQVEKDMSSLFTKEETRLQLASGLTQFFAWILDLMLVLSFVAITTTLLVLVSGMSFSSFIRIVSMNDILLFATVLFSIYYLLYFTVLDLSSTPGKTIFGIRLVRIDNKQVSIKNTFTRSLVSLLSFVALFLPMVIDFQGRLSDTKVVK